MADSKVLAPFIIIHEGKFSNNPKDPGGATMRGVTLATYRQVFGSHKTVADLKKLSYDDWFTIYKKYYWDKCKADLIEDQSIANMLVDFAWHSGVATASKKIQALVRVEADGIIGRVTVGAINSYNKGQKELFVKLKEQRLAYMKACKNWATFQGGWTKRLNDIGYGSLTYNGMTFKF